METGEKSIKCNQCDFATSVASHLRRHLKTHSEEKSNKCNQSNFTSSYGRDLRDRMKIHSGENLNKCNQCEKGQINATNVTMPLLGQTF